MFDQGFRLESPPTTIALFEDIIIELLCGSFVVKLYPALTTIYSRGVFK